MKKALVTRLGAYGDMIILSPVIRRLKQEGYYVILQTSERGLEVYENCPYVDDFIYQPSDVVPNEQLADYWAGVIEKVKPDYERNFCETIEVALAVHPRDTEAYNLSKEERFARCNRNYYEYTMEHAGFAWESPEDLRGELWFTEQQETEALKYIDPNRFNILFCLSGSGHNKFYPWFELIINELGLDFPRMNIITVGDSRFQYAEDGIFCASHRLSGKIPMMVSLALTKHADLVIAPDTGVLHGAGCFDTPKIGLLGHTTIENITKHFKNDHSIEAKVPCAPCMRMIYDHKEQCPAGMNLSTAPACMSDGINPEFVMRRIKDQYYRWEEERADGVKYSNN